MDEDEENKEIVNEPEDEEEAEFLSFSKADKDPNDDKAIAAFGGQGEASPKNESDLFNDADYR